MSETTTAPAAAPAKAKRVKQTPAAEQFAAMGITDEADYTRAMRNAVKQRWGNLPVSTKSDDLRTQLAAVEPVQTPDAATLAAHLITEVPDGVERAERAEKEAARLASNAKVNAWRERGRLQAAIDARNIKFARIRGAKAKPGPLLAEVPVDVTDAATDEAPVERPVVNLPALT